MLLQGLLINTPTPRFAWAVGTQLIFPTASEDEMGGGKWRLVPTVGARYNLPEITPGSWAALLLILSCSRRTKRSTPRWN